VSPLRRIRIGDLLASAEEIANLRRLLSGGGVAAIPTETFTGWPRSPGALRDPPHLRREGTRGGQAPGGFHLADPTRDPASKRRIRPRRWFALWPAPLTVVPDPRAHRRLADSRARRPRPGGLLRLLAETGPLTATSANRAGEPAISDPDGVAGAFEGRIDILIDGGVTPGGKPSTLLDATVEPPAVLRPGAFPWP
jgi:L-threonylcarbamoyladenylate synthase